MQTDHPHHSNGYAPVNAKPVDATERDPIVVFALRWWWLLTMGVVLGIGAVILYSMYGPVSFSTTALIQVSSISSTDPTDNAGQARSAAPNFAAEGESTRMYGLVSQALKGSLDISPYDFSLMTRDGKLDISQQRGTNFIAITVSDKDPDRAELIANTFSTVIVQDINERNEAQADLREQELQGQIEFTRQQLAAAQLFERERQLNLELRDQQQRLLSLQSSYQQEHSRQLEFDQLAPVQEDADVLAGARANFEQIMTEQVRDVESSISDIKTDLSEIRLLIGELPPETDPLISTAYAAAYNAQLSSLTSQSVQEQISRLSAGPPLVQYGDASAPIQTTSLKRLGLLGVAAGAAFGAAIGFVIDLFRKRRKEAPKEEDDRDFEAKLELGTLLHELEQLRLTTPVSTESQDRDHVPNSVTTVRRR